MQEEKYTEPALLPNFVRSALVLSRFEKSFSPESLALLACVTHERKWVEWDYLRTVPRVRRWEPYHGARRGALHSGSIPRILWAPPRLLTRLNKVDGYLYRILSNMISRRSSFENAAAFTQHIADTPYRDMRYTIFDRKCDVHLSKILIILSFSRYYIFHVIYDKILILNRILILYCERILNVLFRIAEIFFEKFFDDC